MSGKPGVSRRVVMGGAGAGLGLALLPQAASAERALDVLVRGQMTAARIPGLALGIAKDGAVTFTRGYGFADLERRLPVTVETMFHIASITKTVTASAAMLLVENGKIALDAPIASHLDFRIAGTGAEAITFRHLLMHSSGISDEIYYQIDFRQQGADSSLPLAQLLRDYLAPGGHYTGTGNVKRPPGSQWDYSNIGYGLLGYLIGRIAGEDMRRFSQSHIFAPLDLQRTVWTLAEAPTQATPYDLVDGTLKSVLPVGFPDWPAGMLRASVADLTCFVAASANGGHTPETRPFAESCMAAMLDMQKLPGLPDWLTGQGLGWQQSLLDGIPRINHWGGDPGVFTAAYLDPVRRTGVVVLTNLSVTPESRKAVKTIAARALAI